MLKKVKFLIMWNITYVIFITLFFHLLFGFNIWAYAHWIKLAKSTLSGLDGLAFGLSIMAFIPIYLASNFYVWKKQKMPISLPEFKKKKPDSSKDEKKSADEPEPVVKKITVPDYIPDELKEYYIRVVGGKTTPSSSDFIHNKSDDEKLELPPVTELSESIMPIPESFDTEVSEPKIPVFHNINFGPTTSQVKITESGKKKIARYTFDDTSLWIADDDNNWFAEGKQIKSPIAELLATDADKRELILVKANIMDIDNLVPKWKSKGIKVTIKNDGENPITKKQ
jgi:hypothetical protein